MVIQAILYFSYNTTLKHEHHHLRASLKASISSLNLAMARSSGKWNKYPNPSFRWRIHIARRQKQTHIHIGQTCSVEGVRIMLIDAFIRNLLLPTNVVASNLLKPLMNLQHQTLYQVGYIFPKCLVSAWGACNGFYILFYFCLSWNV